MNMNAQDYLTLRQAVAEHWIVTILYNKPGAGPITRHVRAYEISVNRSGNPVVWGTDSVHGPRQIHCFRMDRIVSVKVAQRPSEFRPARSITRDLVSYNPDKAEEFEP